MCFRQFTKKSVAIHGERIVSWWHFFLTLSLKPPQNYKLRICTFFFQHAIKYTISTLRVKQQRRVLWINSTSFMHFREVCSQMRMSALVLIHDSSLGEIALFFPPQQPVYWVYPIRKIMRNQVHSPNWWRTCHHVPLICYVSTCLSSHHTYSFFIHSFTSRHGQFIVFVIWRLFQSISYQDYDDKANKKLSHKSDKTNVWYQI